MMAPRLLQNFNGGRALIVTANRSAVASLDTTLAKLGVTAEYADIVGTRAEIDFSTLNAERDILFIDGDLDVTATHGPDEVSRLPLAPVIGLVGVEAPSRLRNLFHLGATAFLRKPVHGAAVYTALYLGINQFLLRNDMQGKLEEMERRRRGRRSVVKAIIALMTDVGVDDDEAYNRLRRDSMRARQNLEDYCEQYLRSRAPTPEPTAHEQVSSLQRADRK